MVHVFEVPFNSASINSASLRVLLLRSAKLKCGGGEHDPPSRKRLSNTSSGIAPLKEKEGENGTKFFFLVILFMSQRSRIAKRCLSRWLTPVLPIEN